MSQTKPVYFEDLQVGMQLQTRVIKIAAQDIRGFASQFDPQPYHLDRDAAEASLFGGLCASGWHVCALMMRLLSDCMRDAGIILTGNDAVPWLQWRKPVFENDELHADVTITSCEASGHGAANGLVGCDVIVFNQTSDIVMKLNTVLRVPHAGTAPMQEVETPAHD